MAESPVRQASASRPEPNPTQRVPALGDGGLRSARREFQRRVLRATLIVDVVVLVTLVLALVAWRLRAVLLLIVVSLFIAALLHPVVAFFERRGLRRGSATGLVFFLALCAVVTIGVVLVHPVVSAATQFIHNLPTLIRQAEHGKGQIGRLVKNLHLLKYVESRQANWQSIVSRLGKPALAVGRTVLSGVVGVVTIVFLTFFLLLELPQIVRALLDWMQPERSGRIRGVLTDVSRSVAGYMLGNFLTSVIAGVTIGITLLAVGVPYPAVLALWVGLVDFLPLIGGLLAGVPTVIVAFLHSLPAGIVTLVVFLVYQQVENHVLNPIIMSRTVRLNPLWVLLAVLLGAAVGDLVGSVFGGLVGALLAVPAASAVQVLARDLWQHRTGAVLLGLPGDPSATGDIPVASAPGKDATRK